MPNRSPHSDRLIDASSTSTVSALRRHSLPIVGRGDRGRYTRPLSHAKTELQGPAGASSPAAFGSDNLIPDAIGLLLLPVQRPTPNTQPASGLTNTHRLPGRRPAAPFNGPLTESLRDSANNPLLLCQLTRYLREALLSERTNCLGNPGRFILVCPGRQVQGARGGHRLRFPRPGG